MFQLTFEWAGVVQSFAPLFSTRVWSHAQALLLGAILAPGKRTVSSVLQALGLGSRPGFQNFHRVLNRAEWSSLKAARILLRLLIGAFAPTGPLVFGLDETIERRWGARIKQRAIYRDAARSSRGVTNKTSGLRWLSLQLLAFIPWAGRAWALPFLTVLAPSERFYQAKGRSHRKLTQVARQSIALVKRWCPGRDMVFVADSSYSAIELFAWCARLQVALIAPLRWDANLFYPAPKKVKGRMGRPRLKGKAQPKLQARLLDKRTQWKTLRVNWHGRGKTKVLLTSGTSVWYHTGKAPAFIGWVIVKDPCGRFETKVLACSDPNLTPREILEHYTKRWQVEVTFEEVRAHLGVETQRQWNPLSIQRATPALLGLFSIVALLANHNANSLPSRACAWYKKSKITFSDALAYVRKELWQNHFRMSALKTEKQKVPEEFIQRFATLLCYAQ